MLSLVSDGENIDSNDLRIWDDEFVDIDVANYLPTLRAIAVLEGQSVCRYLIQMFRRGTCS